jgi:Zn-finger nucleic acid-binding protein
MENRVCVRCTSVLDRSTVGDVEVDLCPSCGGLWLDNGELERIGRGSQEDLFVLNQALTGSAAPEAASDTQQSCPACEGGQLKEVKLGPVTIDYCVKCLGIFLDKGELEQALAATAAQGWTLKQVISAAGRVTGQHKVATQ